MRRHRTAATAAMHIRHLLHAALDDAAPRSMEDRHADPAPQRQPLLLEIGPGKHRRHLGVAGHEHFIEAFDEIPVAQATPEALLQIDVLVGHGCPPVVSGAGSSLPAGGPVLTRLKPPTGVSLAMCPTITLTAAGRARHSGGL